MEPVQPPISAPEQPDLIASLGRHPCLGDALCLASAMIQLVRAAGITAGLFCPMFSRLIRAYGASELIALETDPGVPSIVPVVHPLHRTKDNLNGHNTFVGAYLAALGFAFQGRPKVICPSFPVPDPVAALPAGRYVVLQPQARTLGRNDLDRAGLQAVVDEIRQTLDWPVVVGGAGDTPRELDGADYLLGDVDLLFPLIQRAGLVVGPESAMAHIASGYSVPALIWRAADRARFMWIFDYPDWIRKLTDNNPAAVSLSLKVLAPVLAAQAGIRDAFRQSGRPDLADRSRLYFQGREDEFIERWLNTAPTDNVE